MLHEWSRAWVSDCAWTFFIVHINVAVINLENPTSLICDMKSFYAKISTVRYSILGVSFTFQNYMNNHTSKMLSTPWLVFLWHIPFFTLSGFSSLFLTSQLSVLSSYTIQERSYFSWTTIWKQGRGSCFYLVTRKGPEVIIISEARIFPSIWTLPSLDSCLVNCIPKWVAKRLLIIMAITFWKMVSCLSIYFRQSISRLSLLYGSGSVFILKWRCLSH